MSPDRANLVLFEIGAFVVLFYSPVREVPNFYFHPIHHTTQQTKKKKHTHTKGQSIVIYLLHGQKVNRQ
jgi:hypothetical protein